MKPRNGEFERRTDETSVVVSVCLDGTGEGVISTGVGFFDHMLASLAKHSRIDIRLRCEGDLAVDDHHTLEDCSLALGAALDRALGERRGIGRFGLGMVPMDESLARAVLDLSGRPCAVVDLDLSGERIGTCGCSNLEHALVSLAVGMRATLHLDVLRGKNDHHKAEAGFKSLAVALRGAVARVDGDEVPSTKGVL